MRTIKLSMALAAGLTLAAFGAAPTAAAATSNDATDSNVSCNLHYTLSGWSVLYRTAHGTGTVTCDNGQSMPVELNATGGGLSVGAYKVTDGHGDFTGVRDIKDALGVYVAATAHAGVVGSARGTVMTNGPVTLVIGGTGTGWNIGVGFASFRITRPANDGNPQK